MIMNINRIYIRNLRLVLLLTVSLTVALSCKSPVTDAKVLAEREILGNWDWVKTEYLDRGYTETPSSVGYDISVELDGYSWVRFRDDVRDLQTGYSIEYADVLPSDQYTDAEFVLAHLGYWDFEIKNDSLTILFLNTRGIIVEYIRSE